MLGRGLVLGQERLLGRGLLLRRGLLPIPGTGSPGHAEANIEAASIELSPDEVTAITSGA